MESDKNESFSGKKKSKFPNFKTENNKLNDNIYKNNISFQEDNKNLSLKNQHFENFTKKIIRNNNISKINQLRQENKNNNKELKYYNNLDSIPNKNYLMNPSLIKSIINFENTNVFNNSNTIKNKYNNLYTSSNFTQKRINIIDNINSNNNNIKLFPNLKENQNISNINSSLKNISLYEERNEDNNYQNNIINNNETLKIKAKTPHQIFLNKTYELNNNKNKYKTNAMKSRNKANLFLAKHHSQNTEGYLGRKEINGIPFTFESLMIHNNIYANKSEKKRHEIILDEFAKLRQYIERQPENKLIFIKEFLNKYYIEYDKYDKNQLLALCDFICYHDKNAISSVLKPYLKIKNMIIELLNNINEINNILGIKTEKNNDINNINNNIILEEINSNNDSVNTDEKALINLTKYSSPNKIENDKNINDNIKINFYIKDNIQKNKLNSRYEQSLIDDEEALKIVKIRLRDLEHQKKLHIPDKNYQFRHDLIIKDMNKEMKILKNNFEQTLYNQSFPMRKNFQSKNNCISDEYKISKNKTPITFSQFQKRPKNLKKLMVEISDKLALSNKINKNNSERFMLMKKEKEKEKDNVYNNKNNKTNSMIKYSMDEIIKRLYYKPMKIGFGLNEVRKNNKITEYYALKLAKHSLFMKDINENNYFLKNNNLKSKENESIY